MNANDVFANLQVAASGDFLRNTYELTQKWSNASDSIDAVIPILRFMEDHPKNDYGTPGPLVHFLESFCGHGYEEKLIESVGRKPTAHTIWMLHRLINATEDQERRQALIELMTRARMNTAADSHTKSVIDLLLN